MTKPASFLRSVLVLHVRSTGSEMRVCLAKKGDNEWKKPRLTDPSIESCEKSSHIKQLYLKIDWIDKKMAGQVKKT